MNEIFLFIIYFLDEALSIVIIINLDYPSFF